MNEDTEILATRITACCFCMLKPSVLVPGAVGVFACVDIPKGTIIFRDSLDYEWVPFEEDDLAKLPPHLQRLSQMFCTQDDGVRYLPSVGFNNLTIDFYLNHSKAPNTKVDDSGEGYMFTALRPIKAGEELTYDYRTVEGIYDPLWDV